jgi:hypothetical protein
MNERMNHKDHFDLYLLAWDLVFSCRGEFFELLFFRMGNAVLALENQT